MRAIFSLSIVVVVFFTLAGMAAAADTQQALADRIFGNADKNNDDALDEKEILEAKRIFKAAILQGKKADELPGGKGTIDKLEDAAIKGKLDNSVSKPQWSAHVKQAFDKKESILKDAKEKVAAAKKAAEEREKAQRLQRERELQQKKLQEQKNKNKKPGKK